MNRRRFLSNTSALPVFGSLPGLWSRAAAAAGPQSDAPILVVVELTGGNDGLNMVIPYVDDAYHRARPTIGIAADKVLKLDDSMGLHPAMTGLRTQWDAGKLRVLMNVGYPRPSRSHTRAMEIWQSGDVAPLPTTGWLGRYSEITPERSPSCFVGPDSMPLAVRGRKVAPFALGDIKAMTLRPEAALTPIAGLAETSTPAGRVAKAMEAARSIADRVAAMRPDDATAGREGLEVKLAVIRRLIESGSGSRVYYTSLDGFDTHAGQEFAHQSLLGTLSKALARFQADLEASKLDDRVVVLVFSEFGRRLEENGSKGTDHGAAAPVLLLGSGVAGGLLGGPPDLRDLDEGDVRFTLDFRDLYASLLADWLGVDPTPVVGRGQEGRLHLFR
ncbi:DUF1501 domain-containing protein [Isosphaeraceae bacterium EP7]